jgi:hypothetical protein
LGQDIGGKERFGMREEVIYTDAPAEIKEALDRGRIVEDFLPSPANLRAMENKYKTSSASKIKFAKQLNKIIKTN